MFNKSFWAMKQDLSHGQGIGYSLFGGQGFNKGDSQAILNFNTALKNGVAPAKAWATNMSGASVAAQNAARDTLKAKGSLTDLASGLKVTSVGAKAASIGLKALSVAGNMLLTMGITMAISAIVTGIQKIASAQEDAIAKADEFIAKFNEQRSSLTENKKAIDSMSDDYEELAKGVDSLGRNISLNSDEYARYNEIVNQIADMFPHMVQGYTDEGNAIIAHKGNVEELTKAYQEQKKAAQDAIIVGSADVFAGFKAATDKTPEYIWEESGLLQMKELVDKIVATGGDVEKIQEVINGLGGNSLVIGDVFDKIGLDKGWFDWNTIDAEYISENIKKFQSLFNTLNTEVEAQAAKIKPIMQAYLEQSYEYQGLDSDVQDIVKQIIGQFDSEFFAQFDNETEMASWVTENIVNKFKGKDGEKMSTEFQMMLGIQTQFNKGEITVGEYQEKLSDFLKTIEPLPDETEKYIKLLFGISTDSDGKTSSDVDTMIANVEEKFEGKFKDEIGQLTLGELEILTNLDISPEGIEDWSEVETLIANAGKEADKMTVSLSELEKVSDNIKPLGTAFKELSDDGYITIKTLKEVKDAAGLSGEEWAEYEAKLLKAKVGSSEFNQIMSDLTYKILDNAFAGKDLNAVTEQQVAAILRENGVVNSSAVAHEWLTNAKIKNKLATFDFNNATQDELDTLYKELSVLGLTETAVGELSKAYAEAQAAMLQATTTGALNRLKISQDELKGIKSISDAYKLMAGKSYDVNGDRVGDYYGSEKNRSHFDPYRDQYNADVESVVAIAKAQEEIEKIISSIDTGGTIPNYSGAAKDSSSDKNEALDNYLKDAENRYKIHQNETGYIQELEYAHNNLTKNEKERLDITGKINEAYRDLADNRIKDIEHQIDLVKELNEYADVTDYYKQIQKVSHAEANRLRTMGYDDNSNEIQDLQKTWWDAQNSIADLSYSNSERWINERNTYNDWDVYGDNEIAAWERVLKRFKTEFPNELEKIKDIEQKIFELRKEEMEKSIDDIEDYIEARNTYNDWGAYGDSEVRAIQRITKEIEKAYKERLLSYEEYVDKLEDQSQRLYELGRGRVDEHLSDIDKYIDARNFFGDWDDFGDTEIESIERQLRVLKNAYRLKLISYEDYTEKYAEYTQKLYSVAKDNIIEEVSKLIEDYEEMKNLESSQLESQKNLLQSYYDVTNAVTEAQHEINKELKASQSMYEYLNEETRELLFNQEDYNTLNKELLDIQSAADELQKQYQEDILNASAETIAEITSQYQMQYETMMKQYEIAKAELEVAKKRQKLDNVLAERNTRMFINGQWQWVAKTQDVINAQNELAEAEIERKKREASLEQTEAINDFTTQINALKTDLNEVKKYWSDMQEMLNGESNEVAEALSQISEVSSPELKRVIEATGGTITSFSGALSESTTAMFDIIDGERSFGTMADSIGAIITDLKSYSDAIQALQNKISNADTSSVSSSSGGSLSGSSGGASKNNATATIPGVGTVGVHINSSGKTTTSGLPSGTVVHTAGGDYRITGGSGGNYTSVKVEEKHADGTRYTPGGLTALGEEGFEAYITNGGRLVPISRPTIGNIGAGGIVFNREQMANLRNLWDLSNIGKISPFVSSSNMSKQNTTIDNSIHINGLTVGEQGNEDWINGLRRYVATHR